jgi:hypothetical protein
MHATNPLSFAEVLSDVLAPEAPAMPPSVAKWALTLHIPDDKKQRVVRLAELGNRGELTDEQQKEIAAYRDVGNLLSLLHAKARLSLQQTGQAD